MGAKLHTKSLSLCETVSHKDHVFGEETKAGRGGEGVEAGLDHETM